MKEKLLLPLFILLSTSLFGQYKLKDGFTLDDPILTDSTSTVMITVRYSENATKVPLFASGYYANILFYDFNENVSEPLFKKDVFIDEFPQKHDNQYFSRRSEVNQHLFSTSQWLFYFVKDIDINDRRVSHTKVPSVLYVSDRKGKNLKALTSSNEHAVKINIFEDQGFALIKMLRDQNGDGKYDRNDMDYYYLRLDIKTLELQPAVHVVY
ncbi:hypothetical protein V6R21_03555 [Limibacter armeniacum]|uniref:hypothetical protein n=1 Tax=Limibacter armeniacum TaxID=466084 RepID=UPI002FE5A87E